MKHNPTPFELSIIKPFERIEQKARSLMAQPQARFWLSCAGLIAVIALHAGWAYKTTSGSPWGGLTQCSHSPTLILQDW